MARSNRDIGPLLRQLGSSLTKTSAFHSECAFFTIGSWSSVTVEKRSLMMNEPSGKLLSALGPGFSAPGFGLSELQ